MAVVSLLLWGCGGQREKTDTSEETVEAEAIVVNEDEEDGNQEYKRTMLEDLAAEALAEIRRSIATSDTLTSVFFFQDGGWEDSITLTHS